MAVGDISDWATNWSWEKILSGDLDVFISLGILIVSIAIYSVIIYNFYRFIARRDCFKPTQIKYKTTVGFLRYFFLFPFIAIAFFMGFSLMLIFLTRSYSIDQLLATSFAIIVAIRITSYYTEDLSKDVAKMLPFALLGIFLVDPTYFTIDLVGERFDQLPNFINIIVQFLFLIIIVEWVLRIVLMIKQKIRPPKPETTISS
jgi:hypothetical protein